MFPDISTIIRRGLDRFPGYKVIRTIPVAIPIIDLSVGTSYWEKMDLSIFEQFFLRAVDLGQNSLNVISQTFGLDQDESSEILAIMLEHGLLDENYGPDGTHNLCLTTKGKASKRDNNKRIVRAKRFRCGYYSFSKSLIEQSLVREAVDPIDIAKRGVYIPPLADDEPSIAEIDISDLRSLWYEDIGNHNLELIQPTSVVSARKKFLDGYVMLEMEDTKGDDRKVLLYQNAYYDEDASAALQHVLDQQSIPVFPSEDDYAKPDYSFYPQQLQETIERKTTILHDLLDKREEIQVSLATLDESPTEQPSTLIAQESQINDQIAEVADIPAGPTQDCSKRIIETYEHRAILLRALNEVTEQLYISSASISQNAINEEFIDLFSKAIQRGVSIYIDWGMMGQGNTQSAERQRMVGAECTTILNRAARSDPEKFVIRRFNIHEKVLICDRKFVAQGSFNWLGWDGRESKKYRWESSVYDEDPGIIELWWNHTKNMRP